LRLDPGQAFGTGSHPTTWQCLHWLGCRLERGASVLDYGCGSGVLAIAARKLGAGRAVAVDIDPVALETARANADANGVSVEIAPPDRIPAGTYDVVLANILANPLRMLAPLLAGLVRPGGCIVLAGILPAQADDVARAYRPWIELHRASERDGWVCLSGVRGEPPLVD
jgi:ribosomal protein L11 methyltransferase